MKRLILLPVSAWRCCRLRDRAVVKTPHAPAPTAPHRRRPPRAAENRRHLPAGPLRPEAAAEEQRLLESTRQSIGDVTRAVDELERRSMKPPQQEALRTAKSFIDQARSALDQRDYQRAANLASKARALTDDLATATR